MKRIVQVCHHPFPSLGGPAKTIQQFHAAAGAHTIGFVAPGSLQKETPVVSLAAEVRSVGGKIAHYYYAPASRLDSAEQVIMTANLVLLHGLFTHAPVWAAAACLRHGVPYAIALHGYLDPWALKKSRLMKEVWLRHYGRKILRNASAVICATQCEADKVAPLLPAVATTRVISWACELPDLLKIRRRRSALRSQLGFAETDRVLVFFGRFHSMKRPLETLRLAASVGASNLKLVMVGPDEDVTRLQLEAAARALCWSGLRVVGPVFGENKFEYLALADAYVSLSCRENFNYTLTEAMAAGLPPILSSGNDLGWEFVEEGFSWQLRSDGMEEARQAVMEFLRMSGEELSRRGTAAREWTRKNLSLDRLQKNLTGLIPENINTPGKALGRSIAT